MRVDPRTEEPGFPATEASLSPERPPGQFEGLPLRGSYGRALIVESSQMPRLYVAALTTGGANSNLNPLGLREHPIATLTGLRLIRGNQPSYPILDSYYVHGIGAGTRHRGAAAILQITNSATHTAPTFS